MEGSWKLWLSNAIAFRLYDKNVLDLQLKEKNVM